MILNDGLLELHERKTRAFKLERFKLQNNSRIPVEYALVTRSPRGTVDISSTPGCCEIVLEDASLYRISLYEKDSSFP